ncbi:MAG: DNA-binding response regulator [Firmicutes bacterium HGW-Firmicutes-7]|nr:MAG: DNA-binding response regulator [Firmicutes bacterium HGW-Firmicutes-7]
MNVLVAVDEKDIRNLIKLNLALAGYVVFDVKDGEEAYEVIKKEDINLAVLDVMMSGLDSYKLLHKIREISNLSVIFLTTRCDEIYKILGLGIGADDYLIKPFSMSELIERISTQLRRNDKCTDQQQKELTHITYGVLVLDLDDYCVYKEKKKLLLNAKEFKLLRYLMENPTRVFTKKQLYFAVWEENVYFDDNTIMVHISHIRNKIEKDPKNPKYIITIRGMGYKFQNPDKEG